MSTTMTTTMCTTRRAWLLAATAAAGGLGTGRNAFAAGPTWRLGLAPFLSPAALLSVFRPLREHLSAALGHPVQAYTARDFRAMVAAMHDGAYDVALVPAHLAGLAVADWGWAPLAATLHDTPVLLLVRGGGRVQAPQDLVGRRVGMLDPLSLTAARGTAWLQAQAVTAEVEQQASINSALAALARGHLDAVVAAESQLRGLPPDTPGGHDVLVRLGGIPGPALIGRPGLTSAQQAQWQAAMAGFQPDPARPTTAANSRLTPLTPTVLAAVAAETQVLRRQLAPR